MNNNNNNHNHNPKLTFSDMLLIVDFYRGLEEVASFLSNNIKAIDAFDKEVLPERLVADIDDLQEQMTALVLSLRTAVGVTAAFHYEKELKIAAHCCTKCGTLYPINTGYLVFTTEEELLQKYCKSCKSLTTPLTKDYLTPLERVQLENGEPIKMEIKKRLINLEDQN